MRTASLHLHLLLCTALLLSACARPEQRPTFQLNDALAAKIDGFPDTRMWADDFDAEMTIIGSRDHQLVLSSGSDHGAYGAGFLEGWSESGERPAFDIVTGVSTGALMAPLAFLGPAYDPQLRELYTSVSRNDIFERRSVRGMIGGSGLASTKPLAAMIAKHVDEPLLAQIAGEHREGRRLYVQTTNLDTGSGVVWDMGAIARSGNPDRVALFRDVLLASASVPGVFAPVLIDSRAGTKPIRELHVDGATTSGFFVAPMSSGGTIYLIVNGRLRPPFEVTPLGTFSLFGRALSTLVYAQYGMAFDRLCAKQRRGESIVLATALGDEFTEKASGLFSTQFMNSLFHHGLTKGKTESRWDSACP